ncbi:hypothetical protein OG500_00120 [Kitasatospora sp. NBC_01250]|uniref:hypothetical protein n=1 Tax=Kitasatospora sp. NBC_01250 TaxID=2903571 RepID=UPI002E30ACBC|nr:hypothetical protein [Kitasatospora sp. NBC_01250]
MFDNWQAWGARDLAVIGDSLTGDEIAATFARVTGTPSTYVPVPHEELRSAVPDFGHDYAAMFRFFADRDLYTRDRDIGLLRRLHPGLMTFEDWLRRTGWTGLAPATSRPEAGSRGRAPRFGAGPAPARGPADAAWPVRRVRWGGAGHGGSGCRGAAGRGSRARGGPAAATVRA